MWFRRSVLTSERVVMRRKFVEIQRLGLRSEATNAASPKLEAVETLSPTSGQLDSGASFACSRLSSTSCFSFSSTTINTSDSGGAFGRLCLCALSEITVWSGQHKRRPLDDSFNDDLEYSEESSSHCP